jgi:hypothetical protein
LPLPGAQHQREQRRDEQVVLVHADIEDEAGEIAGHRAGI